MPLVRIPKKYPHKRICIFCSSRNTRFLYCDRCSKYKSLLPYVDHDIVRKFIENPNLSLLGKEFNFPSKSSVVSALVKLRVPVKKYTLNYLLFNKDKLSLIPVSELVRDYEFNDRSLRFLVAYSDFLVSSDDRGKYTRIRDVVSNDQVISVSTSKELGVHHEVLNLLRKFFRDRKIIY